MQRLKQKYCILKLFPSDKQQVLNRCVVLQKVVHSKSPQCLHDLRTTSHSLLLFNSSNAAQQTCLGVCLVLALVPAAMILWDFKVLVAWFSYTTSLCQISANHHQWRIGEKLSKFSKCKAVLWLLLAPSVKKRTNTPNAVLVNTYVELQFLNKAW